MKKIVSALFFMYCTYAQAQNVGIGTVSPQSKLDINGNLIVGSSYIALTTAPANGAIIQGIVGINTPTPVANLDVIGAQYIRDNATLASVTSGLKFANASGANYIESAGSGMSGVADLNFTSMNNANNWMVIKASGNVGIGFPNPTAKLSLTNVNGTELTGTSASSTLKTFAGSLGTSASNSLKLASFGFSSSNQSSLGVKALRTVAGTGWSSPSQTAIGLEMDVDNTDAAGAQLWLNSNGGVGINTTTPAATLQVNGSLQTSSFVLTTYSNSVTNSGHIHTSVSCGTGGTLISGGCWDQGDAVNGGAGNTCLVYTYPSGGNTWNCDSRDITAAENRTLTAYAICTQ